MPDGTSISFSTDLGSLPAERAVADLGRDAGRDGDDGSLLRRRRALANVRATVTVGVPERLPRPSPSRSSRRRRSAPFFAFCSPSFGPNTGGTSLTINGGRFFGDATTTRATFTASGVTREALVTDGDRHDGHACVTPAFPEATSPSVPVDIT